MNVSALVAKANVARNSSNPGLSALKQIKTLHSVLMGRPMELDNETQQLIDQVLAETDDQLNERYRNAANQAEFIQALQAAFFVKQAQVCRKLAESQFRELACNGTKEILGCYLAPEPTIDGVKQASREMKGKLDEAFKLFATAVAGGKVDSRNEFARSLVQIAKAYENDPDKKDVVLGLAPARDAKGREVAKVKILVYKDEIEGLQSFLNLTQEKFTDYKGDRRKRQNVTDVLRDLKSGIAGRATGQDIAIKDDTQLSALIGDLPMRTPVLATTARAIAQMSNEDFDRWLGQLKYSQERCKDLLEIWGVGNYGFFEQSQMP